MVSGKAAWNKLTQGEEYICMDGEPLTKDEPEEDEDLKKMLASWTWDFAILAILFPFNN